jgi:mRNA-degrading endonuclease YafQ of YafQ-DinJ toxin-antitoxin module
MSYKLVYDDNFIKKSAKLLKKHPELKERYYKILAILEDNPFHSSLRLHKLKGSEYYSVSINMNYRILLYFLIKDDEIYLLDIDNHDNIYKNI